MALVEMVQKGKKAMKYIIGESKEDDLIVATLGEVLTAYENPTKSKEIG